MEFFKGLTSKKDFPCEDPGFQKKETEVNVSSGVCLRATSQLKSYVLERRPLKGLDLKTARVSGRVMSAA
jgi:hypothetical protein